MSLEKKIKKIIEERGPLTFAQYMELALFDEEFGYYKKNNPIGKKGDFITAPEISQMFGELVSAWLVTSWQAMGSPENTALIELGPGRGTLIKDILRSTKKIPGFHSNITVHLVEVNEELRKIQEDNLADANQQGSSLTNEGVNIKWHNEISSIPEGPTLLVANEFFDALPIHQFIRTEKGWRENMVGLNNKKLSYITLPEQTPSTSLIPKEIKNIAIGSVYELCPFALEIVEEISKRIKKHGGYALIIDYGYYDNQFKDTFQAIKNHKYHDPLKTPGKADITAYVDFGAIAATANNKGVYAFGNLTQGEFLVSMGIQVRASMLARDAGAKQKNQLLEEVRRLITPGEMGTIFKCMAITDISKPRPFCFL